MTKQITDVSLRKATRVAGLVYLLVMITTLLLMFFAVSKITVEGNIAATISNIMTNQFLFRISGPAYELIMFASVVLLSWALYVILKTVNKNLALLALLFRLVEVTMGGIVVLYSLAVLQLINGENYAIAFNTEQLHALVGLFRDMDLDVRVLIFAFMSLGSIVFYYLFFKSKYIPRIISAFGIFSYTLILIYTFVYILVPNLPDMIRIAFMAPVGLFEIIIGLWLLIKGVKVQQGDKKTLDST